MDKLQTNEGTPWKSCKELDVHQQKWGYNMFRLTSVLTMVQFVQCGWSRPVLNLKHPPSHRYFVSIVLLVSDRRLFYFQSGWLYIYLYIYIYWQKKINCKASIRSFDESNSKAINVDGSKHVKSPIAITNWERAQLPTQVLRDQARRCILVGPGDHGLRGLQRSKLMFILQHLRIYIYYIYIYWLYVPCI